LGIIRFVVQQDQIRCRHRTLSITAPATSTSLKSEHTETSSRKWKFSWLQLTKIKLRFYSITMRTICHAHKFVKEASATSLTSHEILLFAGPRILINSTSIQQFHYLTACVWRHCQTLRIGWCTWQLVTSKHDLLFCCVWCRCSHFQVVFPTVTDTICMFVVADSFWITWQVKQP
jgi:hypothetical protein